MNDMKKYYNFLGTDLTTNALKVEVKFPSLEDIKYLLFNYTDFKSFMQYVNDHANKDQWDVSSEQEFKRGNKNHVNVTIDVLKMLKVEDFKKIISEYLPDAIAEKVANRIYEFIQNTVKPSNVNIVYNSNKFNGFEKIETYSGVMKPNRILVKRYRHL